MAAVQARLAATAHQAPAVVAALALIIVQFLAQNTEPAAGLPVAAAVLAPLPKGQAIQAAATETIQAPAARQPPIPALAAAAATETITAAMAVRELFLLLMK